MPKVADCKNCHRKNTFADEEKDGLCQNCQKAEPEQKPKSPKKK